jgi:energy-coupling factor transport system permease protein
VSLTSSPFAFAPGTSALHRRNAVPKLVFLAAALAFSLATFHPVPLLAVAGAACLLGVWAGVGGQVWRAMRILGPLAASIVVLQVANPAICASGCTVVASAGPFSITAEALARGVSFVSRLLAMESVAVVVLVTTRPADLFGALRRLRVPHPVALMLATTMQLVPLLQRELGTVLDAQRARGMRARGFRAVVPALLPVFVAGFERVNRLAISMEARGYGAGVARTSYRTDSFGRADRVLAWAGGIAGVLGVIAGLTVWGASSVPPLVVPAWVALALVGAAAAAFIAVVAAAVVAIARA